jgi:hypothetical protein
MSGQRLFDPPVKDGIEEAVEQYKTNIFWRLEKLANFIT